MKGYGHRFDLLQILHTWVAINYVVLSVAFVAILIGVLNWLKGQNQDKRTPPWPSWWLKRVNLVVGSMVAGTAMFLFGCGVHHYHMAWMVLPGAERNLRASGIDPDKSVFVGEQYSHHILMEGGQAIGGTLLLTGGMVLFFALRAMRRNEHMKRDAVRSG